MDNKDFGKRCSRSLQYELSGMLSFNWYQMLKSDDFWRAREILLSNWWIRVNQEATIRYTIFIFIVRNINKIHLHFQSKSTVKCTEGEAKLRQSDAKLHLVTTSTKYKVYSIFYKQFKAQQWFELIKTFLWNFVHKNQLKALQKYKNIFETSLTPSGIQDSALWQNKGFN